MEIKYYTVYANKDGRMRVYDKQTHQIMSFPRLLMEIFLGRKIKKTEDVHHKDGNPLNNDFRNLEVLNHSEHTKKHFTSQSNPNIKYRDKEVVCPVCGKTFIWTTRQQASYHSKTKKEADKRKNDRQPPCCSKHCAGVYAATIQYQSIRKKYQGMLQKELCSPKEVICPICKKSFVWSYSSQRRYLIGEVKLPEPCCSLTCQHALRKTINKTDENLHLIQTTIKEENGNFTKAAKKLTMPVKTMIKKLKRAGLPYHSSDYKQK